MHTTELRSDAFQITVAGRPATLADVFPGFGSEDRLGIILTTHHGAAAAGSLILATVTAFYDRLRATETEFFAYPDYFAFHVGRDRGTLRKLDIYPAHKEVVLPAEPELILQAINDRGVTRLLVPRGRAGAPELGRDTLHSAQRRIRTALSYSPSGLTERAEIYVRGSAQSDAFIDAMLGAGRRRAAPGEALPAQSFDRLTLDEALGLLPTAPG